MAGTHPKLVQARIGHSNIGLTMDVYGKLAGDIALEEEQVTKLDALATQARPTWRSFLLGGFPVPGRERLARVA